jgi:hypothetical protein
MLYRELTIGAGLSRMGESMTGILWLTRRFPGEQ